MALIDELVALVPPPAAPVDARGDWSVVEAALDLRLPADFKSLIERYGSGEFVSLIPMTPFGARSMLIRHAKDFLEVERSLRDQRPADWPYPLYPEPGGLLAWATTSYGDELFWLTDGEPDRWPVVVRSRSDGTYERHDVGAVGFLHGWLSGQLVVDAFFPVEEAPWFEPFRELNHVYVKLSEGELPYDERLRILREALAPNADRGRTDNGDDDDRQDHFAAADVGWLLTYETGCGHQIRVAFPHEDDERARVTVLSAARRMGCQVLSTETVYDESAWS